MNIYVPAKGPIGAKIAICGEAPFYDEEIALEPFVGPSGRFLNSCLAEAGINRSDCWVTNVSKYMVVPQSKFGKKIPFIERAKMANVNVEEQINALRTELSYIKPNVIIALGGTALWALTGKTKIQSWRGSMIPGMGYKTIGTYHPAHILHSEDEAKGYWNKQVMIFDLKRAKAQAGFPELRLPQRMLHVARNSYELYDFIKRHEKASHPAIDIEAHGSCIPVCVGISFTPNEGITVPLWNHDNISNIPDSDLVNIWLLLSEFLAKHSVVGQNFGYDRDKLRRLGFIIKALKSDTMLKAFAINPELPKNLAFNTSIYTEEPYYKDEGMYEGSIADLFIGCARDSCVTKEIDLAMDPDVDRLGVRDYYENFVMKLHDLYLYIESNGINCDESIREILIRKYVEWDERLNYQMFQMCGHTINVNSNGRHNQVGKFLFDELGVPERGGTGEEVLAQLIMSRSVNALQKKGIELVLEDRRVKKTIDTYLLSPADFDGKMRTSYFVCLETGRSSTNQQEPPIRPTLVEKVDGKKKSRARGMAFQTITKHGDIGADVRTMLVADEGEIFLQADSSQAEARVIFLLANDFQALKDIDEHDYHALTASWFFGGSEDDYSKRKLGYESPIRFAGKTLRHAGHLGASKRRAATELNTQARKYKIDFNISEADAGKALKIFHNKQPNIRGVFQYEVIKCLEKDRRLSAPVPHGITASKGGTRTFFERWGDELFRQAFSYLPQRTVSENVKAAAFRIRDRAGWIKILLESHDSLLVSVGIGRKREAATILKEEFERPIDFSRCSLPRGELVIPCEIEEGYNYKDLSKFKWLIE